MRKRSTKSLIFLVAILFSFGNLQALAAEKGVAVYALYAPRTAKIEVVGELFDGRVELAGEGSGFLLGASTIVTAAHLFPNSGNYKSTSIRVRLNSLSSTKLDARLGAIDRDIDLAMLSLQTPIADKHCPILYPSGDTSPEVLQPGITLFTLGFPLDKELSIARGILSNKNDPSGEWQTDLTLNPGNSGGPVFNAYGHFLGVAVRRTRAWITSAGEELDVDGVSYFVPTERLTANQNFNLPNSDVEDCWSWVSADIDAAPLRDVSEKALHLSSMQLVSMTKDDHPVLLSSHSRQYERTYQPAEGYKFTSCDLEPISVNHAHDVVCNVTPEGDAATLEVKLTSGPAFDQWRGWYHARVNLQQLLKQ